MPFLDERTQVPDKSRIQRMLSRFLALGFLKGYPDVLEFVDVQECPTVPAREPAQKIPHQTADRSRVVAGSQDLPRLFANLFIIDNVQIITESIDHRFEEIDVARQGFARLVHIDADVAQPNVGRLQFAVERFLDERCLAHTLKAIHNDASTFLERVDQPRHFELAPEKVFADGRPLEHIRVDGLGRLGRRSDADG